MQGQGMSLSAPEKIRVVEALDRLGVHYIEAGFPDSNPKDLELFELLASVPLEQATICAFGMTRRRDRAADDDPGLAALVGCFAPVVTLVGKTWSLHLDKVTRVSREENLAMIADSVALLRRGGKAGDLRRRALLRRLARRSRSTRSECLSAAVGAGAENVTLCDTNGSSLPDEIEEATAAVVAMLAKSEATATVGIHTHNDAECGVANSLAAVRAGAVLVQGTINGYGERTGNANLVSILPALQLKMGYDCVAPERLAVLTETAHLVDEICNLAPDPVAALRRPQRVRPQGRHARRRGRGRRADVRAPGPEGGRQQQGDPDLRARRAGFGHGSRRSRRDRARRCGGPPLDRDDQGTGAPRLLATRRPMRPSSCCSATRAGATSPCSGSRASGS